MSDREKVIKGIESCIKMGRLGVENCRELNCPYFENGLRLSCWIDVLSDALALLKEHEHKDKMYHALEEDWKKLKELLKEQEEQLETIRMIYGADVKYVGELVRCKDCKSWNKGTQFCERLSFGGCVAHRTPPDWFCADGKRREEE